MNTTPTRPTAKQVEDAAAEVHARVPQAVDHAGASDYRRAHAEAEAAEGAARKLKELLGLGDVHPSRSARRHPPGADTARQPLTMTTGSTRGQAAYQQNPAGLA